MFQGIDESPVQVGDCLRASFRFVGLVTLRNFIFPEATSFLKARPTWRMSSRHCMYASDLKLKDALR